MIQHRAGVVQFYNDTSDCSGNFVSGTFAAIISNTIIGGCMPNWQLSQLPMSCWLQLSMLDAAHS